MAFSYKHTVIINSRDVDGHGHCRASALMGHLQEAATQASEIGGFGREALIQSHNAFWMLTRVWFRLERPLKWGEELTIHTWHRGGRGAVSHRDYDLYVNGAPVGEGIAAWVLADMTDHHLIRLNEVDLLVGTDGGELCKKKVLTKVRHPVQLTDVEVRPMRYSDTDINNHVNNTRYADFACDALRMDQMPAGQFLSAMQIGYLAECRPGDQLTVQVGDLEDCRYVRGVDPDGVGRFEATVAFREMKS